jgi:hypothetical protein
MKELRSKKTGEQYIIDDETYKLLVERKQINKYVVRDITPIKQLNLKITKGIESKIEPNIEIKNESKRTLKK